MVEEVVEVVEVDVDVVFGLLRIRVIVSVNVPVVV